MKTVKWLCIEINNNCVFLNKTEQTWRLQALVPGSGRGVASVHPETEGQGHWSSSILTSHWWLLGPLSLQSIWSHLLYIDIYIYIYIYLETTQIPMFNFTLEPTDPHLSILSMVNKIHKLYTIVKSINFNHYQLFTVFQHFKNLTPCLIDCWQVSCVLR